MFRDKKIRVLLLILVIAAFTYIIAYTGEPAKPSIDEGVEKILQKRIYNYTPGARPDYGLQQGTFKNLPPLPQDFWDVDEKFSKGLITDFVEMGEEYYKQPEFYPTFENNLDFIRSPQGGRIYAYGIGAYPGDIGADAFPNSEFTIASFFHSSWLVETHQGVRLQTIYPPSAGVLTPDLQKVDFTVTQDPAMAGKYFNVSFEPELFVLGPTAPVFDENWTRKVKVNILVKNETPKGVYVIGVNPLAPPPEYSELWLKTYDKYADAGALLIGRPVLQVIVFIN